MAKKLTKKQITTQLKLSNLRPDQPDDRDYLFTSGTSGLPRKFDLLQWTHEIENQRNSNSCTANAGVSACEIWSARANNKLDFSRLYLYFNEREPYSNLNGRDAGAYMRDICKELNSRGVCLESTWPFDLSKVNEKPSDNCYTEAQNYKVGRYERIGSGEYELMCAAIAKGYPILIGMHLKDPFFNMSSKFEENIALFDSRYHQSRDVGSHAMLVVGYDLDQRYFLVENSWGDGWGNKGIFALPFDACGAYVHDTWVFTEFAGYNLPELWKDTTDPLVVKQPNIINIRQASKAQKVTRTPWITLKISGGKAPYIIESNNDGLIFTINKNKIKTEWNWDPADQTMMQMVDGYITVKDSALFPNKVTVKLPAKVMKFGYKEPKPVKVPPDEPAVEPVKPKKEKDNNDKAFIVFAVLVAIGIITKSMGLW